MHFQLWQPELDGYNKSFIFILLGSLKLSTYIIRFLLNTNIYIFFWTEFYHTEFSLLFKYKNIRRKKCYCVSIISQILSEEMDIMRDREGEGENDLFPAFRLWYSHRCVMATGTWHPE